MVLAILTILLKQLLMTCPHFNSVNKKKKKYIKLRTENLYKSIDINT